MERHTFSTGRTTQTPVTGYVGSSDLTSTGLNRNYELNVDVLDYTAAADLAQWFEDRWNDKISLKLTSDLRHRGSVRKPPAALATHETSCLGQIKITARVLYWTRAVIKERAS